MPTNANSMRSAGSLTLPAQAGLEAEIPRVAALWGADAVRDSDGTRLSPEILEMGYTVYSTLCLVREDNEWAKAHRGCLQQCFLRSERAAATGPSLQIDPMERYFREQLAPDLRRDPKTWWQVIDRSSGRELDAGAWSVDPASGLVTISPAKPGHVYQVDFLADQIWEPVSMYNHLTNSWTEEHRLPVDPRHPEARAHLLEALRSWLEARPRTDVVRFTTFFYNFDLVYDERGKERRVDWFGYGGCASARALEDFERERGYRLKAEDLVDAGRGNNPASPPSKAFRDWMDFNQRFVAGLARECVELVHAAGKKAYMFLGDHWAGAEPYGPYFRSIGLDGVVGAGGDGVTTRMIADIPVPETEARFYPYLFPDVFKEGGDPVGEARRVWARARRALLRSPVDRMGYGGYLSLACRFPGFLEEVARIAREFRSIAAMAGGSRPWASPCKVYVLSEWGALRSWMGHQVAHSLYNRRCYSYLGVLECLAGMSVEVAFLSFEELAARGLPDDAGVLLTMGDGGTAWSGAGRWADPRIAAAVRLWVARGGGLVGIGEPTACDHQGVRFQLGDVLGVQREMGLTLCDHPRARPLEPGHFVDAEAPARIDFGEGMASVAPCADDLRVLRLSGPDVALSVHPYGEGRAAYIAGLPYGHDNCRLLYRALLWASGGEGSFGEWLSTNPRTECHAFPDARRCCVVNNAESPERTTLRAPGGRSLELQLAPLDMLWVEEGELR